MNKVTEYTLNFNHYRFIKDMELTFWKGIIFQPGRWKVLSKMEPEIIHFWKGMVKQGKEEHKLSTLWHNILGLSIPRQAGMMLLMPLYLG